MFSFGTGVHRTNNIQVTVQQQGSKASILLAALPSGRTYSKAMATYKIASVAIKLHFWDDSRSRFCERSERPLLSLHASVASLQLSKSSDSLVTTLTISSVDCIAYTPEVCLLLSSLPGISTPWSLRLQIGIVPGRQMSLDTLWIEEAFLEVPTLLLHIGDDTIAMFRKAAIKAPVGYFGMPPTPVPGIWPPLEEEASLVCAERLYVGNLLIKPLKAFADVHLSPAHSGLPVAVDTYR